MKNKKGISPLIASILLIGFTVALAAIIMTWGTSFVKKQTEQTETEGSKALDCAKLNLRISGGCDGKIAIDNPQNIAITSLTFRKYDASGNIMTPDSADLQQNPPGADGKQEPILKPLESKVFALKLTGVNKIEVIPNLGGIVCTDSPSSKVLSCPIIS